MFDYRTLFPNATAPPSSAIGVGGLAWSTFVLPTGDTGYYIPIPPWTKGGYLYYGPDGVLYEDSHPGEVYADEVAHNKVGNISTFNFVPLFPFL